MILARLLPGDRVASPIPGFGGATYVAATEHPIWPTLRLVIWRLDDGTWSHDALSAEQDVGELIEQTPDQRLKSLRRALLHPSQVGP